MVKLKSRNESSVSWNDIEEISEILEEFEEKYSSEFKLRCN